MKIGQLLVNSGIITNQQLEKAIIKQSEEGSRLGYHLVGIQAISEEDLNKFLARQQSIKSSNLNTAIIDDATINLITGEVARRYEVIPISREGRKLIVAMTDPNNLFAIDDLRFSLGMDIEPHICASSMVKRALLKYYPISDAIVPINESEKKQKSNTIHEALADIDDEGIIEETDMLMGDEVFESMIIQDDEEDIEEEDLDFSISDSPVVRLVNSLIADAVRRGASDIHFEPFEKYVRVRFRIDGILHEVMRPSRKYRSSMVSRLKIIGGMDIAEHHLPQDGRQKILVGETFVDLRLATLPTLFGEKVEIRLLDRSAVILDLDKLGFEEESLKVFRKGIHRPFGIVLVTGPTGCGKTTTLYSALTELNDISVNIMTAENPVEFNLKGVNQVQMNSDVGLTFANALRAYLRQDPDIIMVGEIRDQETSEIAIRAALTGHLVLSTTHTNDAPSTINRLIDMGTEPFMLSTSLVCIASQRLIRKICPKCKTSIHIPDDAFIDAGIAPERFREIELYEGTGCSFCNKTGYKGRMGIFEVMRIDDDIRQLIEGDANSIAIEKAALEKGMVNMREAALRKLEAGLTTFDEVLRETISNE